MLSIAPLPLAMAGVLATVLVPAEAPTIQAGIDLAADGDTVLVAPGVYTGNGNRNIDFSRTTTPSAHDVVVRSEAGPLLTIIDVQGSGVDPARGFVFENGESSASILDGFTIQNGWQSVNENLARHPVSGGAIAVRGLGTNPIVRNCILRGNHSQISGGAFEAELRAAPTLESCILTRNTSELGGAISLETRSTAVIRDCVITGNAGTAAGGGVYVASGATIEGSVVAGNRAPAGGGIEISFPGDLALVRTIVRGNCATSGEGPELNDAKLTAITFTCSAVDTNGTTSEGAFAFDGGTTFDDPLFCDPLGCAAAPSDGGDHAVAEGSPCLPPRSGCGRIGPFDAACGETPIVGASWGRIKARFGP